MDLGFDDEHADGEEVEGGLFFFFFYYSNKDNEDVDHFCLVHFCILLVCNCFFLCL